MLTLDTDIDGLHLSRDADDCAHCGPSRHSYCADCHGIDDVYDQAQEERLALAAVAYGLVIAHDPPLTRQIRTPARHIMWRTEQPFTATVGGAS